MLEIEIANDTFILTEQNQLTQLSVERIGTYEGYLKGEDGPDAVNIHQKGNWSPAQKC